MLRDQDESSGPRVSSDDEALEHPDDSVWCPRCGLSIPRRMVDTHLEWPEGCTRGGGG